MRNENDVLFTVYIYFSYQFRAQSVYLAVYDAKSGSDQMVLLQHKVNENKLNSKKEHLKLLKQRKEELEKQYEDNPDGSFSLLSILCVVFN